MTELTGNVGFAPPIVGKARAKRRRDGVELMATVALAVSLAVAATAVSIGMAHAQAVKSITAVLVPIP
jgi:Na+/glutamate symporter